MPLDNSFDDDAFRRRCIGWQLKFSLLPRRCYFTKKSLWFKISYKGTAMITGPGDPVFEYRWVDRHEFLVQRIKGNV